LFLLTLTPSPGGFVDDYAQASSSYNAYGGAIYNSSNSSIGSITGDFINNYAQASSYARGGAIYNYDNSPLSENAETAAALFACLGRAFPLVSFLHPGGRVRSVRTPSKPKHNSFWGAVEISVPL